MDNSRFLGLCIISKIIEKWIQIKVNTLSKIIEKWMQIKLMSYLNKDTLLHENQSGFRKNHSTESALILMTDTWLKAINEGKLVGCAMIDFRKAFDLVDHQFLLKKTTYLSVQ